MKIKAVIFDMDGVLIEARDWHYESLNKALGLFGSEITRYDHLVTFDGLPTKKKLEMLSLEGGLPVKLHDFINDLKQEYTWEIVYTKCKPIFHHRYALSKLKSEGITSVFHYLSLHSSPYYKNIHDGRILENSDMYSDCLIRLPLFYELEIEEINKICNLLHT